MAEAPKLCGLIVSPVYIFTEIYVSAHHKGLDPEKICPSLVQEGERDLDLLFYTFQTTRGFSEFVKKPECQYTATDADEDLIHEALENPKNVKELVMAVGIELVSFNHDINYYNNYIQIQTHT